MNKRDAIDQTASFAAGLLGAGVGVALADGAIQGGVAGAIVAGSVADITVVDELRFRPWAVGLVTGTLAAFALAAACGSTRPTPQTTPCPVAPSPIEEHGTAIPPHFAAGCTPRPKP